jgi:hypothetical protein
MGDNYSGTFSIVGNVIYFITIAGAGILASYHFCGDWDYSFKAGRNNKINWLYHILLFVFIFIMGYFALEEQLTSEFTIQYILSQSIWWNISPLIRLLPTMIAYTLLWYCLLLRTLQTSFRDNFWGKILAVMLASFFYCIYHFTSVNEIFTLSAMLDEVMISLLVNQLKINIKKVLDSALTGTLILISEHVLRPIGR